jgi:imidazolonepropionase
MRAPGSYGLIENGTLVVQDHQIAWVGASDALPTTLRDGAKRTHDCAQRCITPGLIDSHTHLVYAGTRTREFEMRLAGLSYLDIARDGGGILSTVHATRAASEATLFESAQRRLHALLNEGVTSVEIKSGYGLDRETELRQLRVARALGRLNPVTIRSTYLGLHAPAPEFPDTDSYVEFVITNVLPAIAAEHLADAVDAFCEPIAFSLTQAERFFTAATAHGLRVKIHAGQLTPGNGTALSTHFKALSADHLEHAERPELEVMAQTGTVAVLLPGSHYFLREKTPPRLAVLRELGIPIALATDCNPGTSPTTSLLLMLNMGCILFGLSPEEALAGVTRNAAQALGIADITGTLEVGKRADFVVWKIEEPSELAYAFGVNPSEQVVWNGTLVKDLRQ